MLKDFFFPKVDPEIRQDMNKECVMNIRRMSFVGMIFMLGSLVIFILTVVMKDPSAWIRTLKFTTGFFICFVGYVSTRKRLEEGLPSDRIVNLLDVSYYLALSLWAVFCCYREYLRGEQLLVFYSVQMLAVCFLPLRPAVTTVAVPFVYACLYYLAYSIDGAKGLLLRNYLVIIAASLAGMYIMYFYRIRMSENTVRVRKANEMLEFSYSHDALTELRNRHALQEDIPGVLGKEITLYMIDINYFKELNDTYGHPAGDEVLKEVGRRLMAYFPDDKCYRYGGDEFLVTGTGAKTYDEKTFSFDFEPLGGETVLLSIGKASGVPKTTDEFYALIKEADEALYEVKAVTHFAG